VRKRRSAPIKKKVASPEKVIKESEHKHKEEEKHVHHYETQEQKHVKFH
jgi:hypothetical protein